MSPIVAEKKQWELFFIGAIYTSIALLLSLWVFEQYASLVMVFLIVVACVPLFYNTIKAEERKDLNLKGEREILKEHSKALLFFMILFVGISFTCALWYVLLPAEVSSQAFSIQQQTISDINGRVTGDIVGSGLFSKILFNNIKVLVFCILFAFIYGVGAIFILTWNASVIGVAIGNFVRVKLSVYATSIGLYQAAGYFHTFSLGFLRYFIHGGFEVLAYFVGGLAGSIISVAVIRHDFATKKFEKIIFDSATLLIIAVALLLVGAIVEVYITPVLF